MIATITLRFIQSRETNLKNFLRAADFLLVLVKKLNKTVRKE
jgi:hypothetical protein